MQRLKEIFLSLLGFKPGSWEMKSRIIRIGIAQYDDCNIRDIRAVNFKNLVLAVTVFCMRQLNLIDDLIRVFYIL
jgi:hypothetical protein